MTAANDVYKTPADPWARLAAPLPENSIFWRQDGKPIARDGRFFACFIAYVDTNTVRERLDAAVPGEWDLTLTPLPALVGDDPAETTCSFKARLQVLGVVREDVGMGRDYKQAATDAFKCAAVRFGVAHELYAYGPNWVELDGDGKGAKPLEDPAVAYARRQSSGPRRVAETSQVSTPNETASPAPQRRPMLTLDEEKCPKCGGRMWDNRLTKRNPRAPDFRCRDRSCDGVIWPSKSAEKNGTGTTSTTTDAKAVKDPAKDWPPLAGGPLLANDADLPF